MAVFTYIGTYVAGTVLGLTTAAGALTLAGTIVSTVVAGGLAYATARALGVYEAPQIGESQQDPGVSIQLPPATDNKLAVLYGQAFTSGPVFDAAISNENQTMTYCIALSEDTQTGTFSCDKVFMNDAELVFGPGSNAVSSHRDPNQTTTTDYNGKIRLNIYQGGSAAGDQIFPSSGATTAATSIVPHWGVNHTANSLVFAVLQIDYDAENGLAGLPQMTFKMNNTLNNPGDVLFDYLTSDRYGAGLSNAQIDVTSITGTANTSMKGYCDELVSYVDKFGNPVVNKRYQINGMVSTFDTCSRNIDKICQNSATFFTFNPKQGEFAAIPNRQLSVPELANCLVYNDDNIVSTIDISSTELYSLYNGIEVTYMDQNRKDQNNTILIETPAGDRNANEPDNVLKYNLELINDNVRAERLANLDLNQSRVGTIVQFESDFSGLQTDAGDVIKITSNLYGWDEKLFRVMRVSEKSTPEGMLTAQISALEYTSDYYTDPSSTETQDLGNIDLPRLPIIPPIYIPQVYNGSYGNLSALPGSVFGNVIVKDTMKTFGAGAQIEDQGLANTSVVQDNGSQTFNELITPAEYDITGVDKGDFTFNAFADHGGGNLASGYDMGFKSNGNITFANATTTSTHAIGGGGVIHEGFTTPTGLLASMTTFSTDATDAAYGLTADYEAVSANVVLEGFTDADSTPGAPRAFDNMSYQIKRITKGEK